MAYFIDTHSHIYLSQFDADREEVIEKAREKGILKIFLPAIDSTTHEAMLKTEEDYEGCKSMIGLHPCSVTSGFDKELEMVASYLERRSFIAIGEIGLDFYWDKTYTDQQYEAFRRQIQLARQFDLPVVIHSRNAIDECIDVLEEFPGTKGVFHCFSGDIEQSRKIIDMGMFLGIGGVVSYKNAGLDKILPEIGIEWIILETDAPYLAPVPFRGKRNEPAYIETIAQKVADVMGMEISEVGKLTTENALKLFDKA